jgi:hypothetical protein
MQIDNHTDTCCFGANFTPLYFTGQVCDVSPFTDTYDALQNIEVCTATTAWDHPENGRTLHTRIPSGFMVRRKFTKFID